MDHKFSVLTSDTVTVNISTSFEENCMVNEKTFKKSLTVRELKLKFEVWGASADTMKIKVFNEHDEFKFELDDDEMLLGAYPVNSGMRLHIEDKFLMKRMLSDESNVEKFVLTEENYEKRDGRRRIGGNDDLGTVAIFPRGRGRGLILKDNMERLQSVKVKQLRRPGVKLGGNSQQRDTDSTSDTSKTVSDIVSSSNKSVANSDKVTISATGNIERFDPVSNSDEDLSLGKPTLNPEAPVFVPREIYSSSDLVSSTGESITCAIPIIDPKTGLPVDLGNSSCLNEDYDYDDDADDEFRVVVEAVSKAALLNQEDGADHVKYEREVHDLLDVIHQHLSCNPGLYLSIMKAMETILHRWCGFTTTLKLVAKKLVQQGAAKNYAYLSARVCTELDKITNTLGVWPMFRTYVLDVCEEMHNMLPEMLTKRNFDKAHGTIAFFAELFVQLTVKGQTRITMLGMGVMKSLDMLLDYSNPENIICLCKILKLCGWALDNDHKEQMGKLLGRLVAINCTHKFDSLTVSMLNNVVSLADQQWGRSSTIANSSSPTTPTSNCSANGSYYSNSMDSRVSDDTTAFTEDEFKFLNDNFKITLDQLGMSEYDCEELADDDDGMDDEACAAFEEFLSTMPNSKTSNLKRNC